MGELKALKIDAGTGWKEIHRETGTGWKALTWEGVPIDVGGACEDRLSYSNMSMTRIDLNNAANASGILTNVCCWMKAVGAYDLYFGIFYQISGNTYKCRSAVNAGRLDVGENNEVVSLAIEAGDIIGAYGGSNDNRIETGSAGAGHLWHAGNCCVVNNETTYSLSADRTMSLYGTG